MNVTNPCTNCTHNITCKFRESYKRIAAAVSEIKDEGVFSFTLSCKYCSCQKVESINLRDIFSKMQDPVQEKISQESYPSILAESQEYQNELKLSDF